MEHDPPSPADTTHPAEDTSKNQALLPQDLERGERLLYRLTAFCHLLWESGIAVGPHQLIDLAETLTFIDITRQEDFFAALKCSLLTRHEQETTFDQLFSYFWLTRHQEGKKGTEHTIARAKKRRERQLRLPPSERKRLKEYHNPRNVRMAQDEMQQIEKKRHANDDDTSDYKNDRGNPDLLRFSAFEQLRKKDFADFTWEELQDARAFMTDLHWTPGKRTTQRKIAARRGDYPDLRRIIRRNLKHGGEIIELTWRKKKLKARPLIIICDISGSMSLYSRLLLHFIHTLSNGMEHVEAFVFGTQLTRITRQLKKKDVDDAVYDVSNAVRDWSGGTRIGDALHTFNHHWGRRVLGRGAVVILISDGWDRGDIHVLQHEMDRLQRSCHHFIWLNPLLGSSDYRPLTQGMKAALPFIDTFLPANNLESLIDLGQLLATIDNNQPIRNIAARQKAVAEWIKIK